MSGLIAEVQRIYNWEFKLPDDVSAISAQDVSALCQSIKFGQYEIVKPSELQAGVFRKFYAGELEITNINASFLCVKNDFVASYFRDWRLSIISDDGSYGYPVNYKRDGYILFYDRVGNVVNNVRLKGLFPTGLPKFSLDYSEDIVKYEIDFRVDTIL